jgi:hypothetical protein
MNYVYGQIKKSLQDHYRKKVSGNQDKIMMIWKFFEWQGVAFLIMLPVGFFFDTLGLFRYNYITKFEKTFYLLIYCTKKLISHYTEI